MMQFGRRVKGMMGFDYRPWEDLTPDTLALIFTKLPLDEILIVVPRVCKSWAKVVRGPYCWQEIDIEDWSRYRRPESLDRMLQLLISRSCGSLRKLCVYGLSTSTSLSLIANNAMSLQNLRLPRSEITNAMLQQVAPSFSGLTSLDLSYCTKIGAPALESLGRHCKLLQCFHRNMHPWDVSDRVSQDDEAFAIAATMPKLKHLELAYLMITTEGVVRIVSNCHQLELLDMRGCWNVNLDQVDSSRLKVVGPLVLDHCGEMKLKVDHFGYYYDSSIFFCWQLGDIDDYDEDDDNAWGGKHKVEEIDLMSYGDFDVANIEYGPQKP